MSVSRDMPLYQCHKKVGAFKIANITRDVEADLAYIAPEESGYCAFDLPLSWVDHHKAEVGGYYVVYDDGYKSYSPASAFESGYTRIS